MKNIIITIISVIILGSVSAQTDNADAVFEKVTKTYTLNEDGSTDYQYFKQLKLLTHVAFNRFYGETFIVYNPEFQELKINDCYTVMADGTKVEAPDNAFNEVLPRPAAHSSAYNHLREMVVTHTALELGATIFLDYTITTKSGYLPALMANEIIEESSPVNEMEIIVKVPADVELQHTMYNLRTAPEIMVVGSEKVYTWKFSGLKASPKEGFRGDLPGTPRLVFSTANKMGTVVDWITQQKAFDYKMSGDMTAFVEGKINNADEIQTMRGIQEEVVNNMALDHAPMDWTGFRVRTPVEVWESNGGTALEKAVLLTTLLDAANFNAVPVVTCPEKFFDKNSGNLLILENAAVKVNTKGFGTIYLSVNQMNDQTLENLMARDVIIPLYKNADFSVINPNDGKNVITLNGEMKISSDLALEGIMDAEFYGAANPFLKVSGDTSAIKSQISGGLVAKEDQSVKILNSNIAKTEARFELSKENPFEEYYGYYKFQLPEANNGFKSWHISYLSSERLDDFVLPFTIEEKYEYSIEIPAGFEFVNAKHAVNLKNKSGAVKIEISPKNNAINVKRELTLNQPVVTPAEYEGFRELVNEWLDENMKMVVFRKAVD